MTRVEAPDEDDWGKLKRVLKYLWGTRHMKLTLTVDNLHTLRWWVDAAYGVHWDSKGHTGMMMGKGLLRVSRTGTSSTGAAQLRLS